MISERGKFCVRQATRADILGVCKVHEDAEHIDALVAYRGDEKLAVAGVYYHDGRAVAFSDIAESATQDKRLIVHGCRILFDYLYEKGITRMYAIPDKTKPTAVGFLTSLGFRPTGHLTEEGEYYFLEM